MDRYLTFFRPNVSRDGAGETSKSWTRLGSVSAELMQQSSREFRAALARRSETEYVFRIRYNTALSGDMRVQYEGTMLQLLGNPDEDTSRDRRAYMIISAARVKGV